MVRQACLDLVSSGMRPDLIFLDIAMPSMNGYEVYEALVDMSLSTEIPVIFVTGNTDEFLKQKPCHWELLIISHQAFFSLIC
ncbi:MAG: response regulator [Thiolinea sp.]